MFAKSIPEVWMNTITIMFLLICCNFFISILFNRLRKYHFFNDWIFLCIDAAYMPLQFLLWIFGFFSIYYQLSRYDTLYLVIKNMDKIQNIAFTIPFCWFLFRLKQRVEVCILAKYNQYIYGYDPVLIAGLSKLVTILIAGFSCAIVLYFLGVPLQSFIVFQGAVSIALGLAAQNILGNGFGGFMILINRQFKVGDLICSPDKKVEGFVQEIRWYSTQIMTLDRKVLYVPNSIFTHIIIINSSHIYNRYIRQFINIQFQDVDKINAITDDIQAMLKAHESIDQNQLIVAHWIEFGSHGLRIEVSAFTKTIDPVLFRKIQQDICLKIAQIIKERGVEILSLSHLLFVTHDGDKLSH